MRGQVLPGGAPEVARAPPAPQIPGEGAPRQRGGPRLQPLRPAAERPCADVRRRQRPVPGGPGLVRPRPLRRPRLRARRGGAGGGSLPPGARVRRPHVGGQVALLPRPRLAGAGDRQVVLGGLGGPPGGEGRGAEGVRGAAPARGAGAAARRRRRGAAGPPLLRPPGRAPARARAPGPRLGGGGGGGAIIIIVTTTIIIIIIITVIIVLLLLLLLLGAGPLAREPVPLPRRPGRGPRG